MATGGPSGNPPPLNDGDTRHVFGPRPVGALLPGVTRAAFRKRSPATAQLLADWPTLIGPALAAVTHPRRLVSGTLTLACSGPIALELQHLAPQLMARINGQLGRVVVDRLRFVQAPPRPIDGRPRPQRPPVPVDVPGIPPGPLHDALAALGAALQGDADA